MKDDPTKARLLARAIKAESSLLEFVRLFWHVLEPESRPLVENWHIDMICRQLEAISRDENPDQRLLMNVPPGMMKSMLTDVFFPAWEWGPCNMPATRYVCTSYSAHLTERDNLRFLRVIQSPLYQEFWGTRFAITHDGVQKIQNDRTGWKLATSVGGVGTGERGDRVIIDDPHNVKDGESEVVRNATRFWFREVMPSRLNDRARNLKSGKLSAIIVIMQRVHDDDVSGLILDDPDLHGYEHMMLPMHFDPQRAYSGLAGEDPRTDDGDLIWPERFPADVVASDERLMGKYATAAQHQQSPEPRGGGVVERDWWQLWPPDGEELDAAGKPARALRFPDMNFILLSVDTAMSTKQSADESAITAWGCWRNEYDLPKVMLMGAWSGRAKIYDLVNRIITMGKKFKADRVLIEAKANGLSVAQEIQRLQQDEEWGTSVVTPTQDKLARLYACQHLFEAGIVFAPNRTWADKVITQCAVFPKGKHDDLVDSATQALNHLRIIGLAVLREEREEDLVRQLTKPSGRPAAPYDV